MEAPPAKFKNPPTKTASNLSTWANLTKKGAPILPKLDIAYVMPKPVDLMVVGKVYEDISPKRANPTVLNNLLMPKKIISTN